MENYIEQPNPLETLKAGYDEHSRNIEEQINTVQSQNLGVSVSGLVSKISSTFNQVKAHLMNAALASTQRASMELDAYFGSTSGDQRAAVRVRTMQKTRSDLMSNAFSAVASLADQQVKFETQATLEAAQVNIQAAQSKNSAVGALMQSQAALYSSFLAESNRNYLGMVDASIQWATLDEKKRQYDSALTLQMAQEETRKKEFLDTMKQRNFEFMQSIGLDREKMELANSQFEQEVLLRKDQQRWQETAFWQELGFKESESQRMADQFGQEMGFQYAGLNLQERAQSFNESSFWKELGFKESESQRMADQFDRDASLRERSQEFNQTTFWEELGFKREESQRLADQFGQELGLRRETQQFAETAFWEELGFKKEEAQRMADQYGSDQAFKEFMFGEQNRLNWDTFEFQQGQQEWTNNYQMNADAVANWLKYRSLTPSGRGADPEGMTNPITGEEFQPINRKITVTYKPNLGF